MKQENKWIYEAIEQAESDIKAKKNDIKEYTNAIIKLAEQGRFQQIMEFAQYGKDRQWEIIQAENTIKSAKKYLEEDK